MIVEVILYLVILATAYPAGLLLAWICDDEIVKDRKYILVAINLIVVSAIILAVINFNLANLMSLIYMICVLSVMAVKGYLIGNKD